MKYDKEHSKEIIFPLGGIGTGSIGLTAEGRLVDWEIFNRPDKGSINGYTHFAIRAVEEGAINARILNGDFLGNRMGVFRQVYFRGYGYGPESTTMAGFPHFKDTTFEGAFPFANLSFADKDFPAKVQMTAFNPFIPNDADASSIPAAFFTLNVANTSDKPQTYELAFTVANPFAASRNEVTETKTGKYLTLSHATADKSDTAYGELTVATDAPDTVLQCYWYRGEWQDGIVSYWNEFSSSYPMRARDYAESGTGDTGTVAVTLRLAAGEEKKVRFVLAWHVPNCYCYWDRIKDENGKDITWKNYYATVFEDSRAVADYALSHFDELYARTERFATILHGATLPPEVIDAASANLSVLKSPTALRLEDGSFWGWEGLNEKEGSCEGTCQHVWTYAYALPYLFPDLERTIRNLEFAHGMDAAGGMRYRLFIPFARGLSRDRSCLDGQMGAVFKSYREWKLSGDNEWLANKWSDIKKALSFAWREENPDAWDRDHDGILEGCQHHTLDMEMYGPSSWLEGMYLLALKTAAEMACFLGDTDAAKEYTALYENGKAFLDRELFNGKYFMHKIDLSDKSFLRDFKGCHRYFNEEAKEIKYQIANGSALDQMLAQWHADLLGAGELFDAQKVDTALDSMMALNFKERVGDHANPWRLFSLNDESGSVICAYPADVKKPAIPISYCEETMTGFEYAFAGLLLSRGHTADGLRVVRAIRGRFNGQNRNPWNEFECGSNYARSMASYALIPLLSGFTADLPHGRIGFHPKEKGNFRAPFSLGGAWGEFVRTEGKTTIKAEEGALTLTSLSLPYLTKAESVTADGKALDFRFAEGVITFSETTFKEIVIA